jgi:hypothetical protein
MASDYGLNFGFRRSDESVAVREGRLKTPVTGTFRLGSLVMFDAASVGFLKAATAGAIGEGATVGLLVQEEIWNRSIYETKHLDSFSLGTAYNNRPSVLVAGAGTKVWFANTAGSTRADGRVIAAVLMVEQTSPLPAVLDYLTWDGTKFTNTSATFANSMLRVTWVDATNQMYEAVLTR